MSISSDKRRNRRQHLTWQATLWRHDDAHELVKIADCVLHDISSAGARVILDETIELPASFTLILADSGVVHRECRCVWRYQGELGVKFPVRKPNERPAYLNTGVHFAG